MRLSVNSVFGLIVLLAARQVSAQSPAPINISEITTSGRGEVRVAPDRATVLITVETHASSAGAASSANSRITGSAIKAVRGAAASEDTVTTESYMVMPDYEKGKPSGFQARNTVRVQLHDIARVGAVVDAALAAGATQVPRIEFTSSLWSTARRKAIKLAVAEAHQDAEALADAAGGTVGKLLSINAGNNFGISNARLESVVVTGVAESTSGLVPPPMIPNDVIVSVMANTRWEFVPRRTP